MVSAKVWRSMHTWQRAPFSVSTQRERLDIEMIHEFLRGSYWASSIPRDVLMRSIEHSICFGLYHERSQIGFARVISDRATFAYLADVFVLDAWRGRGLSKFLMECVKAHPELQGLRRWMLATADAHGLYARFGFAALSRPERMMEIVDPEIYLRAAATGAADSGAPEAVSNPPLSE